MFRLPIFLIALLPKPQRGHRYACVWDNCFSNLHSQKNILRQTSGYLVWVILIMHSKELQKNNRHLKLY